MLLKRLSPAQKLLTIFLLTIFAPGLLLAIFGARALWQEQRMADRQLRDRLDRDADLAIRALANDVARLQSSLDAVLAAEKIFGNLPKDGSWVFVERRDTGFEVYPPNILLYELGTVPERVVTDSELSRAEQLETQGEFERAIASYRELMPKTRPALLPKVQHHLARTLQKAGRTSDAVSLWRQIENSSGRIGSLPADLVAGFELASMDDRAAAAFYKNLTGGRWRLEKARYLYYLSEIRKRTTQAEDVDKRLRFAEATEAALSSSSQIFASGGETYVAFRRNTPFAVMVVSLEFLKSHVWTHLLNAPDFDARIVGISANNEVLYSAQRDASGIKTDRSLGEAGLFWKVEVEPRDAAGFYAAMNRKRNLYLAMLSLVVLSLASGGYFMARTVRRELEVARMKSEFVSTVSHEFRSPLTGIRQLGEMLARDRVTDESKRHQYYELIVRESERLARLVENVLDFSRMEAGRKQYRFEPVDTSVWLNVVAEDFQLEASRSGHRLQADIPERLPEISGDREALSTALRNLLENACKYSPGSDLVWLHAERLNGGVRIRVRDRGVGISTIEQRQIFEKFYRGDRLAKEIKGVGLGLSLVQHIVAAHHGEIRVESREGEGTTFSMYLHGVS